MERIIRSILHLDADAITALGVVASGDRRGVSVYSALSAANALLLLEMHEIDLIVLDVTLDIPTCRGFVQEVARTSKPFLYYSAVDPETIDGLPGAVWLPKPASNEKFWRVVHHVFSEVAPGC